MGLKLDTKDKPKKNNAERKASNLQKGEKKSVWKKIRTPLAIIIAIIIFAYIFTRIDGKELVDTLIGANIFYLSLAFILIIPVPIISALRWQITLKAMGYDIPLKDCFQMIMGVLPLTSITPAKSGDVIKGYYLKDRVPVSKTVGSVLTERIFDVLALTILCIIGLIFFMDLRILVVALIILSGVLGFFLVSHLKIKLPISQKWNRRFQNLFLSTKTLFKQGKLLTVVIVYTFCLWIIAIVQTYLFFQAVGLTNVPILFVFANTPIAIFIGQIPLTPGGTGLREGGFIYLFSEYDPDGAGILGVGILFTVVRYWTLSIAGAPYFYKYMKEK
ncbi:MAG: flippase-like domain-containing protein [Thermoplasmata archaeon]|nr:flippase-like domain-containing protein [Thermoplasmata archaeon]